MSDTEITRINEPFDEELADHCHPHLFTSARWIDVLKSEYDFDFYKISLSNPSRFIIVANIKQFGFSKIKGLPFCDYIIPSVKTAESLDKLIESVRNHFQTLPVEIKMILPDDIKSASLSHPLRHTAYLHIVCTCCPMKEIEDRMDNSFMRGVRKAESNNLTVSFTTDDQAVKNFYDIYCRQRVEKFKKLPQPFSFFQKIRDNFLQSQNGFILEARKDLTVIASMLILEHDQQLYYKFGCSRQEYLDLRPNNLLFYRLFEHAQDHNFKQVDLGLSGVSDDYAGLVRFKEYMGGVPNNIYSLRINPENYDDTAEKKLHDFTSSLTKTIVGQHPNEETANSYSNILYPYFA